jgi:diguanylate cyclase (GGDEF)-like protein
MSTRTANGGVQRLPIDAAAAHAASRDANLAELRRVLAATERRCAAALRQLDRMRRRDSLREQQAVLLTDAVLKARRFAYHDELTGLPNRRLLLDRFNLAAALAARHQQHVALLFLDLDGFKHVNDTFGHTTGDKLLQEVAARLVACVRASDTVCRYGGDEFVVLLSEIAGTDGAVVVAENIRVHIAAPYLIDGAEIAMTASLGMAVYPGDARDYDELLRLSDLAMYRSKTARPAVRNLLDSRLG